MPGIIIVVIGGHSQVPRETRAWSTCWTGLSTDEVQNTKWREPTKWRRLNDDTSSRDMARNPVMYELLDSGRTAHGMQQRKVAAD